MRKKLDSFYKLESNKEIATLKWKNNQSAESDEGWKKNHVRTKKWKIFAISLDPQKILNFSTVKNAH